MTQSERSNWIEAGELAASIAEDQGQAIEPGREPTPDELTVGVEDSMTVQERRAAWREGWDTYCAAREVQS